MCSDHMKDCRGVVGWELVVGAVSTVCLRRGALGLGGFPVGAGLKRSSIAGTSSAESILSKASGFGGDQELAKVIVDECTVCRLGGSGLGGWLVGAGLDRSRSGASCSGNISSKDWGFGGAFAICRLGGSGLGGWPVGAGLDRSRSGASRSGSMASKDWGFGGAFVMCRLGGRGLGGW
jgi:hypothetical protein